MVRRFYDKERKTMPEVFVTGDKHGEIEIKDLSLRRFPAGNVLTKRHFVVILGDFGLLWGNPPPDTSFRGGGEGSFPRGIQGSPPALGIRTHEEGACNERFQGMEDRLRCLSRCFCRGNDRGRGDESRRAARGMVAEKALVPPSKARSPSSTRISEVPVESFPPTIFSTLR